MGHNNYFQDFLDNTLLQKIKTLKKNPSRNFKVSKKNYKKLYNYKNQQFSIPENDF